MQLIALLSLLSQEDEEMLSRISSQTRGLAAVRGKLYVYVYFSCIAHYAVHTAIFFAVVLSSMCFSECFSAIIFVKVLCYSHTLLPERTSICSRCACEFILGGQSERRCFVKNYYAIQ